MSDFGSQEGANLAGFSFDAPMPWWGEHDALLDADLSVELPPEWNVSGDLFLVWAPGMTRVVAWPREAHALRVAQIMQADLSRYDAETRQELEAEAASNLVSRVEDGRLEVTPQMAEAIAQAGASAADADVASPEGASASFPVEATVLGMQDHLEIWNRAAFKAYVRGIDLSSYCEC